MPIYEYKCSECGAHFEKMQKVSEKPLSVCEVCGGKLEKQWSLSGFQFKGAGWYVTDYSNKLKETGAGKSEKSEKTVKTEIPDKSDNDKKSSSGESTAKPESASNTVSDAAAGSKTEATVKKD